MRKLIYNTLLHLLLPAILLRLWWRGRKAPAYRKHIQERFGRACSHLPKDAIVIHAVSVGETVAAKPLIHALQTKYPTTPIILTHMTPTGRAMGNKLFGEQVSQYYLPYDFPWAIASFLRCVQPKMFLMMETEVWPNWIMACWQKNIPIGLINARLSEKSFQRYQKAAFLLPHIWPLWDFVLAQTQDHAARFLKLGVRADKLKVVGQMKFDLKLGEQDQTKAHQLKESFNARKTWLIASSHEAEEDLLLKAARHVAEKYPHALLVWVPRHPERFKSLGIKLNKYFNVQKRSEDAFLNKNTHVYLIDTMGELPAIMAACDVIVMAGSFSPIGGHNPLEAAMSQKAVITGPYVFNFEQVFEEMVEAKAVLTSDREHLAEHVCELLSHPERARCLGQAAWQYLNQHQGATELTVNLIRRYLPNHLH